MTDLTSTIEADIEAGLALAETVLPSLMNLPPWVIAVIEAAMKAVQTVSQSGGAATPTPPAAAAAAVVDHLTPGAPLADALK
jgi:hypothetical protein